MSDDSPPPHRKPTKPPANDNPRPGSQPFLPTRNAPLVGEGPVANAVRFVWNLLLSATIATMIAYFLHAFASDATETLGWMSPGVAYGLKIMGGALGLCVAAVLFVSYYLDEKRN